MHNNNTTSMTATVAGTSVTGWLDYLFNIWQLATVKVGPFA